ETWIRRNWRAFPRRAPSQATAPSIQRVSPLERGGGAWRRRSGAETPSGSADPGSVREKLDAVAVRVGNLHPHEPMVVLPLGLLDAGRAQPLARGPDLIGARDLEAEVVGTRQPG